MLAHREGMIMKRITVAVALLLGFLLSACGQSTEPTTSAPASSSAPSVPASALPAPSTPAQTTESAWETYKREVREAGFVNPNEDDGSISDDQMRQSTEAVCQGPGGAEGVWELYEISIQMKPQQVDMPRIKQAAIDFCASVGR